MKLSFNLENISCIKIEFFQMKEKKELQLALKEKKENEFIAVTNEIDILGIETPQNIILNLISNDGLYKTSAELIDVYNEDNYTYFVISNPKTLDYQQNREYYRVLAKHDCFYTIDDGVDVRSYAGETYDISAGGVSIILDSNDFSQEGMSIVICMPDRDIKSHLRFIRCEIYDDNYKLSFAFTDLSEKDYNYLSNLCVNKQLSSL